MIDVITRFTAELRNAGLRIGLSEELDAFEALREIPLLDRRLFKAALSATLVKRSIDHARFDLLFEIHFATLPPTPVVDAGAAGDVVAARAADRRADPRPRLSTAELDDLVFTVLFGNDVARMPEVADLVVDRYSGITPGTHLMPSWFVLRTVERLRLPAMLERLMDAVRDAVQLGPLEERLTRDEFVASIARFRAEVVAAVRRRFVTTAGVADATRAYMADEASGGMERIESMLESVNLDAASESEIQELRRALDSLARKFAARMTRNHRDRIHGRLDTRHTIRASMGSGGVPAELRYRHTKRSRPEIAVLVDVSASVSPYARFFLELVYAMSSQFTQVRSFAFIADIEEISESFEQGRTPAEAAAEVSRRAQEQWVGQVSDYGRALESFWSRWGRELDDRVTVMVLGDARSNGRAGAAWVTAELRQQVRRVYWLNPEPRWDWNEDDSIIEEYEHTSTASSSVATSVSWSTSSRA